MASAALDLLVVGGGPAGLAHALWRQQAHPELRFLVTEARPRVGGWLQTEVRDGYVCEHGPQGFRPNEASDDLLALIELSNLAVPSRQAATRRWVLAGGSLRALPTSPGALLRSPVLRLRDKLRLLWEPRVRSSGAADESVRDFFVRRFGPATQPYAQALVHGVFGGDADRLEVRSAFPIARQLEVEHGSVLRGLRARRRAARARRPAARAPLYSFPGGMQQVVDEMAVRLGDAVRTSCPVAGLRPRAEGGFEVVLEGAEPRTLTSRCVELAVPASVAAQLVAPFDDELSRLLGGIRTASVASTFIGASTKAVGGDVEGFGFLAARGTAGSVLGTIYCSSTFGAHAPPDHVLFRVMSGGVGWPAEVDRDGSELIDQAVKLLRQHVDLRGDPAFTHVLRARDAIPQYERGHQERLAAIAASLQRWPGLNLRGASYRQVSVVGQWSAAGSTP
ncbi:MAG: protoporphyrinogen oxidase [Planctomycetota bacterium]